MWGKCSSQAQRMALAFSRIGRKVLYIECGGDPCSFEEKKVKGNLPGGAVEHPEMPGLFVMRASSLPGFPLTYPNIVRKINCSRTGRRIVKFCRHAGWTNVVLVHYGWYFREILDGTGIAARTIYECLDEHTRAPNIAGKKFAEEYIRRIEGEMLASVEVTVYSNPLLAETRKSARRYEVLPLGVDAAHFGRVPTHDPLTERGIGKPRLGFLGLVTVREDWDMVRRAAEATPEWSWVVIGPRREVEPTGPKNLHWIGAVDYSEVPDWTRNWQAGIIPLTMSDFNVGSWPLKFYEYLASGLPIATTPIPAAPVIAKEAPGLIYVAGDSSHIAFIEACRKAVNASEFARRQALEIAANHTWESRAKKMLELPG